MLPIRTGQKDPAADSKAAAGSAIPEFQLLAVATQEISLQANDSPYLEEAEQNVSTHRPSIISSMHPMPKPCPCCPGVSSHVSLPVQLLLRAGL